MSDTRDFSETGIHSLESGWSLALVERDACQTPDEADHSVDWIAAVVPGTAATALMQAGLFDVDEPRSLAGHDVWYRVSLTGTGAHILHFAGLATECEIWLDGNRVATSTSMFVPLDLPVILNGTSRLYLRFKGLSPTTLPSARRRQKWRPHLIADAHLRHVRSTLLGHTPGWCPSIDSVGPFRPVTIQAVGPSRVYGVRLRPSLSGNTGILDVALQMEAWDAPLELHCAGVSGAMLRDGEGVYRARLEIADVALWWPHTHGMPVLHEVLVENAGRSFSLGKTGFRSLHLDRGADGTGFSLVINGERIFCRGANWTNADLVSLPGERADYLPLLTKVRDAGMNMLRVSGIMAYESAHFHQLLDELGILCWQDLMLANFDYDFGDAAFLSQVQAEVAALIERTGASPSLAVVCGGSEVMQQAAMLSLPESLWSVPFFNEVLPTLVASLESDAVVVPNSPFGGALPFVSNVGVSHYYGVGAYCRPLEDARRSDVKFASECLAFANLPQPDGMPSGILPGSREWKARVVRDLGAEWDFEDTRDFYLELLYGVNAAILRFEDPARYLCLSQTVPGEVMEATYGEWRRVGSLTAGALVWFLKDLGKGFGWGVMDHHGRPKAPFYALGRAFRPVQVILSDEGLNGLDVHVINETENHRSLAVSLQALATDGSTVIDGHRDLDVAPRSAIRVTSHDLFGIFFDITHAYRFGPPAHDTVVARLVDRNSGARIAEAFHFPLGRGHEVRDCGLTVRLEPENECWLLHLAAEKLAQSIHISCPGFEPQDNWFHLAPGGDRTIRLIALAGMEGLAPSGFVAPLNSASKGSFG